MPSFRVFGADRETGLDTNTTVEASDRFHAENLANSLGIFVSRVVEESPQPPAQPAAVPGVVLCRRCGQPLATVRDRPDAGTVIIGLIGMALGLSMSCAFLPAAIIGIPLLIYSAIRGSMGPVRYRCNTCG